MTRGVITALAALWLIAAVVANSRHGFYGPFAGFTYILISNMWLMVSCFVPERGKNNG